jgi:hypothetical protein
MVEEMLMDALRVKVHVLPAHCACACFGAATKAIAAKNATAAMRRSIVTVSE